MTTAVGTGDRLRVATGSGRLLDIELLAPGLLRTPGFDAGLLDGGSDDAWYADQALLTDEDALDTERTRFRETVWPTVRVALAEGGGEADRTSLNRARRRVRGSAQIDADGVAALTCIGFGDWTVDWNALIERVAAKREETERCHAYALLRARQHVRAAFEDQRLHHAVFLSNPEFYAASLEPLLSRAAEEADVDVAPPARVRRTLLTAHRYLRRFSVRCETVSFFGPVLFIGFAPRSSTSLSVGDTGPGRVVVEASAWLVEALEARLTEACTVANRVVTPNPLFVEAPDGSGLRFVSRDRTVAVPDEALRVWREADGDATVSQLADRLRQPVDTVAAAVKALGRTLHISACPIAAVELHPLQLLAAADGATGPVTQLSRLRDEVAATPWPARRDAFARLWAQAGRLGLEERRHAGQHYADRELVHEDRASPYSERVVLGGAALDGLRGALGALLPVCYLGAILRREDARRALRAELAGASRPLAQLATQDIPSAEPLSRGLSTRLAELVRERVAADAQALSLPPTVNLTLHDVDAAMADLWTAVVPPGKALPPCLPSPDLMAMGDRIEDATWILSELHDDCSSFFGGLERTVHSNPDELWENLLEVVRRTVPVDEMATIVSRRRSAHVTPELPGLSIELSGRSCKPRSQVAPIGEAMVRPDGTALEVRGRCYQLYPGDLSSVVHRALALPAVVPVPVSLGAYTPRIKIDGAVYQRATWSLRLPERDRGSAERFDRWLNLQRLRHTHGLPRRVFVRHPDEVKPLYVDFADPLAVADLGRLLAADITVTEMLPTPEETWWRVDGRAQCAEIRMGCRLVDGGRVDRDVGEGTA